MDMLDVVTAVLTGVVVIAALLFPINGERDRERGARGKQDG